MAETDFGGRAQARCALHPEEWASGTCERCGNFMCGLCSDSGTQPWCPTCRERASSRALPLRRDTWTFSALWEYAWAAFQKDWLNLSLAALIVAACSGAAQFFGTLLTMAGQLADSIPLLVVTYFVSFTLQYFVQGVVTMGMLRVCFDVLDGKAVDLARLFTQIHKAGRYLLSMLIIMGVFLLPFLLVLGVAAVIAALAVGIAPSELAAGEEVFREAGPVMAVVLMGTMFVLLVPALYFGLPLVLLQAELAHGEESALGAIRNCYVLARGHRLGIFLVSLAGVGVILVGLLMCCIGVIPAAALAQLLTAGLYLSLRQGSELEQKPR